VLAIVVARVLHGARVVGGAGRGARPGLGRIVVHTSSFSPLALGDLLRIVRRRAGLGAGDLDGARAAVGALVIRDAIDWTAPPAAVRPSKAWPRT
jgi:hypothetical protein